MMNSSPVNENWLLSQMREYAGFLLFFRADKSGLFKMIKQRNTEPLRFRTEGEKKVFGVSQASDRQRVQTPRINS